MKKRIAWFLLYTSIHAISFEEAQKSEKTHGVLHAMHYYKQLAQEKNPEAMFRLAQIYASGQTVQQSLSTTKAYLEEASNLNHLKSTYFLGKFYLSQKTIYHDPIKAYNLFLQASKASYAPAQNMIGEFLLNGIAIEKDYMLAVKYFEEASKQGWVDAHCNLAFMYASGKGVFPNFGRAHAFAKEGMKEKNEKCLKVWEEYNLKKYPEDKGWKFNFYTKP